MYKVFINNIPVILQSGGENLPQGEWPLLLTFPSDKEANNAIIDLMDGKTDLPIVISHNSTDDQMLEIAFSGFKRIDAAGGLVLDNSGKLLLIFRNEKWDLPKGKIDKGEAPDAAAVREVMEECGIKGHSIKEALPSTWHCYEHKGNRVLKKTYWYIMQHPGNVRLTPQLEEGITKVEWRSLNDLEDVMKNTYPSVIDCIKALIAVQSH